jgi:hypothetical protein
VAGLRRDGVVAPFVLDGLDASKNLAIAAAM